MSTTERKARKRAGIRFEKPAKVGTPRVQRRFVMEAELASLDKAFKAGDLSKREYEKAGRAVDLGRGWRTAVPRIARNARRAQKGGK